MDKHFGAKTSEQEVAAKVDAMYAGTKVLTLTERLAMFGETEAQLQARKDPLLAFGLDLATEVAALDELKDRRDGARASGCAPSGARRCWPTRASPWLRTPTAPCA